MGRWCCWGIRRVCVPEMGAELGAVVVKWYREGCWSCAVGCVRSVEVMLLSSLKDSLLPWLPPASDDLPRRPKRSQPLVPSKSPCSST